MRAAFGGLWSLGRLSLARATVVAPIGRVRNPTEEFRIEIVTLGTLLQGVYSELAA